MSKRKDIIRENDLVKIVNPKLFIRCGYPLSKNIARRMAIEELNKIDDSVFISLGLLKKEDKIILDKIISKLGENKNIKGIKSWNKMVDLIAENILLERKFGGNNRSIYTLEIPEIKDKVFKVMSSKMVNTGFYHSGHSGYDYDGNWDGYPPYLEGMESHKILEITNDSFEKASPVVDSNSAWEFIKPLPNSISISSFVEKELKRELIGYTEDDLNFFMVNGFFRIEAKNCVKIDDPDGYSCNSVSFVSFSRFR